MGREFTNALNQTPLWRFAIKTYGQNKDALLFWQNKQGAHVNLLLAMAFASQSGQRFCADWQTDTTLWTVIAMTERVRIRRKALKNTALYTPALNFELELEGLQIIRLQQLLMPGSFRVDIESYEKMLGIKKGALGPFIQTLVN